MRMALLVVTLKAILLYHKTRSQVFTKKKAQTDKNKQIKRPLTKTDFEAVLKAATKPLKTPKGETNDTEQNSS